MKAGEIFFGEDSPHKLGGGVGVEGTNTDGCSGFPGRFLNAQ